MKTIAVIGGGAAGMMAAASVLETESQHEVILIEKNPLLGRKVLISGGGRCNVTTGLDDIRELLKKYPRGSSFLRYSMHEFSPRDVYEWFESHGVPLKIEEDLRVFPVSDEGKDVVSVFEKIFSGSRGRVILGDGVTHIEKLPPDRFKIICASGTIYYADAVIITSGGEAYRHTGSTGDGYAFAMSLGHSVTALAPSLSSIFLSDQWAKALSGVSLPRARLSWQGVTKQHEFTGPFLFTNRGISGPAVFALSSLAAFEPFGKDSPAHLEIDFVPDITTEAIFEKIWQLRGEHPTKQLHTIAAFFVPHSVAQALLQLAKISSMKIAEAGKDIIRTLAAQLKKTSISGIGRGAGDEFVTAGGVKLAEVDDKTMQSRICPGLYFAGEILDIDGFTGGFNLQAAWATGRRAGLSAGK